MMLGNTIIALTAAQLLSHLQGQLNRYYSAGIPAFAQERLEAELHCMKAAHAEEQFLLCYTLGQAAAHSGHILHVDGSSVGSLLVFLLTESKINPLPAHYYCRYCGYSEAKPSVTFGLDLPAKVCPCCGTQMERDGFSIPVETVWRSNGRKKIPMEYRCSEGFFSYLQYEDLQKTGLDRFDNWVKTFARPEEVCEIDVDTSGFRVVYRFKEFFNLTELSKMFGQISIFHSAEQADLPELSGYTDVVISKNEALDAYMKNLYARTEAIRAGDVDRKKDNMLKVSTDGRKAALSLELVGKEQSYDPKCKLWHCVQNVLDIYHRHDGCSQLVFCDYATPQNKQYSIYSALGKHLADKGIPSKEIAFVHTCKTEEQKLKLYDAVNFGKIRVLIGSTFKLGVGANVQTKLKAIHHLDVPWRPADMVQREGRILRRGNENKNILIFRYIVEGSFDSYSWQILQTKQHFISQFLSGAGTMRSIQDFENDELNYAQVKALALSEPLMKEYTEKENELRRARMVLQQELEQKTAAKTKIFMLEGQIKSLHQQLVQTEATAVYVAEHMDILCEGIADAAAWVLCERADKALYSLGEFTLQMRKDPAEKLCVVLDRGGVNYTLELGRSLSGNKTRFKNFFLKFSAQVENLRKQLTDMETRKSDLKQQVTYASDDSDRITRLEQELNAIFVEISRKAG